MEWISCDSAREACVILKTIYEGTNAIKVWKIHKMNNDFENLTIDDD